MKTLKRDTLSHLVGKVEKVARTILKKYIKTQILGLSRLKEKRKK